MESLTKRDLAMTVLKKQKIEKPKEVEIRKAIEFINFIESAIIEGVKNGKRVELRGFGSFYQKESNRVVARNISKGKQMIIPIQNNAKFKASPFFTKQLN